MALNKDKVINGISLYALVSQFIISTIFLSILGYYIGFKINNEGSLKGIIAVIFGLIGIISFIIQLLLIERRKNDKKSRV